MFPAARVLRPFAEFSLSSQRRPLTAGNSKRNSRQAIDGTGPGVPPKTHLPGVARSKRPDF